MIGNYDVESSFSYESRGKSHNLPGTEKLSDTTRTLSWYHVDLQTFRFGNQKRENESCSSNSSELTCLAVSIPWNKIHLSGKSLLFLRYQKIHFYKPFLDVTTYDNNKVQSSRCWLQKADQKIIISYFWAYLVIFSFFVLFLLSDTWQILILAGCLFSPFVLWLVIQYLFYLLNSWFPNFNF